MGSQQCYCPSAVPNGTHFVTSPALTQETNLVELPELEEQLCDNPSRTLLSGSFLKTSVTASHSLLHLLPRPSLLPEELPEHVSLVHVDSGDTRSKNSSSDTQEMVQEIQKEVSSSRRASIQQVLSKNSTHDITLETDQVLMQPVSDYILSERNLFQPATIAKDSFVRFRNEDVTLNYSIGDKLGEGGFGVVYKAVCRQSGVARAAKMLKRSRMPSEELRKVENEVELLRQLDHPNILKVYEAYLFDGHYCIITELCEGGSLSAIIRQGRRFTDRAIRAIMGKLMGALAYLHELGIAHRDIKLDNILLMQDKSAGREDIRLIDFGLAKVLSEKRMRDRVKVGTYTHMAPEVLRGIYSTKCDIWSSGIALCCLATAINPFKKGNKEQTFESIMKSNLSFDAPCWRNVNADLKNLAQRMLTKDMSKRVSAAGALAHPFLRGTQTDPLEPKTAFEGVLRKLSNYYQGNNLISLIESYLSYTALTPTDLQQLSGIFRSLDLNGDGFIQRGELEAAFLRLGWSIGDGEVQYVVGKVDKNKSGRIDYSQFVAALSDRSKLFTESALVSAFRYFDANSSGFLEKEELRTALKLAEGRQLQFLLGELDKDQDHRISQEEFVNYLIPDKQR